MRMQYYRIACSKIFNLKAPDFELAPITGTLDGFLYLTWAVRVESCYAKLFPSFIDFNKLYVTK